jgi:hypothetical protein
MPRSKTFPALSKGLQGITECEECFESDAKEKGEGWQWRGVGWFLLRHCVYSCIFLKLDRRLGSRLLFTFKGVLKSKTAAFLFYLTCSATAELLIRKVQESHLSCLTN